MAALADARIDCLDLLAAGVGAVAPGSDSKPVRILDPAAAEHDFLFSSCVVGYLPSRDEIVEMWSNGSVTTQTDGVGLDELIDSAVAAARGTQILLKDVLLESLTQSHTAPKKSSTQDEMNDVEMNT